MAESQFLDTTATRKIFQLSKRIRAVSGGTSASKTISILVWCIDYAQCTKNEVITVVAESVPHLLLGAIRDFQNIMQGNSFWDDERWNESKHIYTFSGGTIIEFISFDKFGKAHGPRRDILFLNEANNIPWNIADQLITRTRKVVWMDWNPSEEFWFYTEMLNKRQDIDFITLTYLDNEALDEVSKAEIEAHKHNKQWWTVYGEGKLGVLTNRIYSGWKFLDEIPNEARLERYGLDFGFNDPAAIMGVHRWNSGYVLDEILYRSGMLNKQLADILLNIPEALTIADSAEPKSIEELKQFGVNIQPTLKGPDSIRQGINIVKGEQIWVTKRSVNLIKEYRNYLWQTDKNGGILNIPEAGNDHCMDAVRYAITSLVPVIRKQEFIDSLPLPRHYRNQRRVNPAL